MDNWLNEYNQRMNAVQQGTVNPTGAYTPLVMGTGENAASDAASAITRAKYEDWKNRFFPKVDELMNMTTYVNKNLVPTETANAFKITNETFDNVTAGQQRNLARYGMSQTAEQRAAQSDALSLGRAAAIVNAEDSTRLALKDRDRAIASGGLGGGTV